MKIKRPKPNWHTVAGGVAVLLLQTPFIPSAYEFQTQSVTAIGEVVRLNAGGFHPEVVFTTQSGERISIAGSSSYPTDVGDRIEVRYMPDTPKLAKINQIENIWGIEIYITAFSAIFIIGGLFGMRAYLNRQAESDA